MNTMKNEFSIDSHYHIYYTNKDPVPINIIIEALESIENILLRTNPFIEQAYSGFKIYDTKVFIEDLKSGSLDIKFLIKRIVGDAKYERGATIANDAKNLALEVIKDIPAMNNLTIAAASALITFGAVKALDKPAPVPQPINITIHNNGILNGGGTVTITSDEVSKLLEKQTDKKKLAKDAIDYFKPAKLDPHAEILVDNNLTFTTAHIKEVPDHYEPPQQNEREQPYSHVDVYIYASDRDKTEQGWAGIVPSLFEKRVPFKLAENIKPDTLHGRTHIKADVLVLEKFNVTKKAYEVKAVEIISIA